MSSLLARTARYVVLVLMSVLTPAGIVFVVGMRRKWPTVLNAVRRSSRATQGFAMRSAGAPGADASVVRHVGRSSGRTYETPVRAVPTHAGFAIALPYGPNSDWLKNVLAQGTATIVYEGTAYPVDQPRVVPLTETASAFTPGNRRSHRLFGVKEALTVRRVPPKDVADGVEASTQR
jgi:deazaflavin-dependent oxidoreductase (nitroreductase family)